MLAFVLIMLSLLGTTITALFLKGGSRRQFYYFAPQRDYPRVVTTLQPH